MPVKYLHTQHPAVAAELAQREQVSKYLQRPLRTYEEAKRDIEQQRKREAA